MTPPLLVSIVVVNYNYARYLREAIDSALAQRYAPAEVVVVDDGSTDESRAVIASYGARLRPVLKANGGQASAFNAGFAASRGALVLFLDADDRLAPEAAGRVAAAWRPGVAKVQFRLQVIDASGERLPGFEPALGDAMPQGDLRPLILSRFDYVHPPTSGNAYARAVLERILPLPEEPGLTHSADHYVNAAVPFYGEVVSLEEPLGDYRRHGTNAYKYFRPSFEVRLWEEVQRTVQREALVERLAREQGLVPPRDLSLRCPRHASLRLALRVVAPDRCPRPDTRVWLARRGILAVWTARNRSVSGPGLPRRVAYCAWFLLAAFLPGPLARRFVETTLVRWRASRPKAERPDLRARHA